MKLALVKQARESLDHIGDSLQAIMKPRHLPAVERAWSLMLQDTARVFAKLGKAHETEKESEWWARELKHRASDPVLSYARCARNADYHGIDRVTALKGGGSGLWHGGRVVVAAPAVTLLPVKDGSVVYPVPTTFMGQPVPPTLEYVAMSLEMAMRALVQSAEVIATGTFGSAVKWSE